MAFILSPYMRARVIDFDANTASAILNKRPELSVFKDTRQWGLPTQSIDGKAALIPSLAIFMTAPVVRESTAKPASR
jgi:hypothetical protein